MESWRQLTLDFDLHMVKSMESRVSMPDFVQIEREVTEESSYDSYLLAEKFAEAERTSVKDDDDNDNDKAYSSPTASRKSRMDSRTLH